MNKFYNRVAQHDPPAFLAGYGVALASTALAALVRWMLPWALTPAPYLGFYPAVVVSAALGGLGPGLVATFASLFLVNFVFGSFNIHDQGAMMRQVIWVIASIGVSLLAGMQREARMRERRQAVEIQRWNDDLEERVAAQTAEIRKVNETLELQVAERTSELQSANNELEDSRRAAINLMEDALGARKQSDEAAAALARIHKQTEEDRRKLEAILETIPVGVVLIEAATNRFSLINRRAAEIYGTDYDGVDLEDHIARVKLLQPDGMPFPWEDLPVSHTWRGEEVHNVEMTIERANGIRVPLVVNTAPLCDAEGNVITAVVTFDDITERKRAEEELRESEERLRLLIDGAKDFAIFMLDVDGRVTSWNEGARRLKGWDVQEILGRNFSLFYTGEAVAAGHPEHELEIAADKGMYEEEGWRVRKDGSKFIAEVMINAIRDESGKLRGFSKITRDITARKKADEALQESERKYSLLFDKLAVAASLTKLPEIVFFDVNKAFEKLFGYTREEVVGKTSLELGIARPEEHKVTSNEVERQGQHVDAEKHVYTKSGEERIVLINVIALELNGQSYALTTMQDITERKRAEEELSKSEEKFRGLFNWMGEAIQLCELVWDEQGQPVDNIILDVNPAYEKETGLTREQVVGRRITEILPVVEQVWLDRYGEILRTRKPIHFEEYNASVDRWFDVFASPMEGNQFAVAFSNVTDRKQAQEAMHRSEERFRALATASSDVMYRMSPDWSEMLQLRGRDFLADTEEPNRNWLQEYIHPIDQSHVKAVINEAIRSKSVFELEHRVLLVDGALGWTFSRAVPLLDANGEIVEWFGAASDVTERKRAEEALAAAKDRLAADFDAMTRLQALGALFVREGGMRAVLDNVVETAIAITNADMGNIQLLDKQSGCFRIMAHRGFDQSFLDFWNSVTEGQGVCGTAVKQAERVIVEDVTQSPIFVGTPALDVQLAAEVRAVQSTPLVSRSGNPLGMFSTHFKSPHRPDERSLRLLDLLARQAADIIERSQTEDALKESEEQLRALADSIPNLAWWANADGYITWYNRRWYEYSGTTPEQMEGWGWQGVHDPNELPKVLERWQASIATGEPFEMTFPLRGADGVFRPFLTRGIPLKDAAGRVQRWFGTNTDVSPLKQAEEQIKASLNEKEVMLKEIHHRVKNNLQVISSLVGLQADGTRDETVREVLRDVTFRVRSMALVHEKLYQSADLARIDFAEYAKSLLNYLWRAHGSTAAAVRLTFDLEPVSLPVDTAVPCGLILNELAGNALKHAFRGRSEGEVIVTLQEAPDGRVSLCLRDNGVGLPPELDWRQTSSLGLRLVQMLAGQLNATVEVSGTDGTKFEITFGYQADNHKTRRRSGNHARPPHKGEEVTQPGLPLS